VTPDLRVEVVGAVARPMNNRSAKLIAAYEAARRICTAQMDEIRFKRAAASSL
jgi:hypothetical protein